jgi:uncharacterized protein YbbK (DUF523 family)
MQKILVSGCLLGQEVRYNGAHKRSADPIFERWLTEGRVVSICPELAGGLAVPRLPAEILGGVGGAQVLNFKAKVIDSQGADVSSYFMDGAQKTLALAQLHGVKIAVLKEGSPSCGSSLIGDGTFSGTKVKEVGVTTALLVANGIMVFNEFEFAKALQALAALEQANEK